VTGPRQLEWGDYSGNRLFQSLGNTAVHPPAGLLFVDLETGSTLPADRRPRDRLVPRGGRRHPGAERVLRFSIDQIVERTSTIPLRWARGRASPFNPPAR
jgi:hypothetical protein